MVAVQKQKALHMLPELKEAVLSVHMEDNIRFQQHG